MGGYRSGSLGARPVAEQSCVLPIRLLAPHLSALAPGGFLMGQPLRWTWANGELAAALRYTVSCADSGQITAWLAYAVDGRIVSDPVAIVTTRPNYGGKRYWWRCPDCGRRVGVLFRPPGAAFWRCRHCHDITYTSSNQAHQLDRLLARADRLLGEARIGSRRR